MELDSEALLWIISNDNNSDKQDGALDWPLEIPTIGGDIHFLLPNIVHTYYETMT